MFAECEENFEVVRSFECKGVRVLFTDPIICEEAYFSDDEAVYNAAYHAARDGYNVNDEVVLDLLSRIFYGETTAADPRSVTYNMTEVPTSAEQAECFAAAAYECDKLDQEVLQQLVSLAPMVKVEVLNGFHEEAIDEDGEYHNEGSGFQGESIDTFYYENGSLVQKEVTTLEPQGWDYCYNKTLFGWGCYS